MTSAPASERALAASRNAMRAQGSALAFGCAAAAGLACEALPAAMEVNRPAMGCLSAISVILATVAFAGAHNDGKLPAWYLPQYFGPALGAFAIVFSGQAAPAFTIIFIWVGFLMALLDKRDGFMPKLLTAIGLVSLVSVLSGNVPIALLLMIDFTMLGLVPYVRTLVAQIETLSRTDQLTGVANRRAFYETLDIAIKEAQRFGQKTALLMIDIDHFKEMNDKMGHLAGDKFLQEASAAWQSQLRSIDLLGRFGGEEFVVLLRNSDLAAAQECAERLRSATPEPTTCSIGVAELQQVDTIDRLISRADGALYQAKSAGRNRTVAAGGTGSTEAVPA